MNPTAAIGDVIDVQHDNLASRKCLGKRLLRRLVALWIAEARANHCAIGDIGIKVARREALGDRLSNTVFSARARA